jgi:hypothetical protein
MMNPLTPRSLPFIFLAIAAVFLVNYLRHLGHDDQRLAQRGRLRLLAIFALVGGLQLLLRASR